MVPVTSASATTKAHRLKTEVAVDSSPTGVKEAIKTEEEDSNNSSNKGNNHKATLINSPRIHLSNLGNKRQMILIIRKQAKRIKVRLVLVEINTSNSQILSTQVKEDLNTLTLSKTSPPPFKWVDLRDNRNKTMISLGRFKQRPLV